MSHGRIGFCLFLGWSIFPTLHSILRHTQALSTLTPMLPQSTLPLGAMCGEYSAHLPLLCIIWAFGQPSRRSSGPFSWSSSSLARVLPGKKKNELDFTVNQITSVNRPVLRPNQHFYSRPDNYKFRSRHHIKYLMHKYLNSDFLSTALMVLLTISF